MLAIAANANAATDFQIGKGAHPDVFVDSGGTAHADIDPGFSIPTTGAVGLFNGSTLVHAAADSGHSAFNRETGPDPNAASSWSGPTALGPADEVRLAGGPAGLVLSSITGPSG